MESKQTYIEATCPECRGPLTETQTGDLREYRCLVGHQYSARSLLKGHSETEERTLWAAVVVLEEAVELVEKTSSQFAPEVVAHLKQQARVKSSQAMELRAILKQLQPFQLD
jgi:two-component system chemotaxis response regulator CheB